MMSDRIRSVSGREGHSYDPLENAVNVASADGLIGSEFGGEQEGVPFAVWLNINFNRDLAVIGLGVDVKRRIGFDAPFPLHRLHALSLQVT